MLDHLTQKQEQSSTKPVPAFALSSSSSEKRRSHQKQIWRRCCHLFPLYSLSKPEEMLQYWSIGLNLARSLRLWNLRRSQILMCARGSLKDNSQKHASDTIPFVFLQLCFSFQEIPLYSCIIVIILCPIPNEDWLQWSSSLPWTLFSQCTTSN